MEPSAKRAKTENTSSSSSSSSYSDEEKQEQTQTPTVTVPPPIMIPPRKCYFDGKIYDGWVMEPDGWFVFYRRRTSIRQNNHNDGIIRTGNTWNPLDHTTVPPWNDTYRFH